MLPPLPELIMIKLQRESRRIQNNIEEEKYFLSLGCVKRKLTIRIVTSAED